MSEYYQGLDQPPEPKRRRVIPAPSLADQTAFSGILCPKSAILTAVFPQDPDDPESTTRRKSMPDPIPELPSTITSLFDVKYKDLSVGQLSRECHHVFDHKIKVTAAQAEYLTASTKLQSQSLLWFEHRLGRLTASRFGTVCKTNPDKPSKSLLSAILNRSSITAPALKWGQMNEERARQEYKDFSRTLHDSFSLASTGLHVNPLHPHLGASPDGLISCSCCGEGLLEIKCPYNIRDMDPRNVQKKGFYLVHTGDTVALSRKHDYFYQVQGQMAVCNRSYTDFVCWTPVALHTERVLRDPDFISEMMLKLQSFFIKAVLPRVLRGQQENEENE